MSVRKAYNSWASQYDTNKNRTRDLEGVALRATLADVPFKTCLEIGCGTGKNTEWLVQKADKLTAADFSEEMLEKAGEKVKSDKVEFVRTDINEKWQFTKESYDLISFSLVLEHIKDLSHIFKEASALLKPGGYIYAGELHPFKQYMGTKARFDTVDGRQEVECYTHNISEFVLAAKLHNLQLVCVDEFFDEEDRGGIPRILVLLFKKGEV